MRSAASRQVKREQSKETKSKELVVAAFVLFLESSLLVLTATDRPVGVIGTLHKKL
jgi:hypothetical protein